jgi:DNA phosphorothioation-associated putative methyltransferase
MSEMRRERTASNRKSVSAPTRWAHKQGLIRPIAFDWGCGRGKDAKWLQDQGIETLSYDPYFDNSLTPDCVDFEEVKTILLIDVLNVIEDREEREGLISDVEAFSYKGSLIIVSVPRIKAIESKAKKSKWESYADGFVTKSKTFTKGYTLGDFADSCMRMGSLLHVKKMKGSFIGIIKSD